MKRKLLLFACYFLVGSFHFSAMASGDHHDHDGHGGEPEEIAKGPHGGRLLKNDLLTLELTVFESGIPPEFRVYAYQDGKLINPSQLQLQIRLERLGGDKDIFQFSPINNYLRGNGVVTEPHSFDVHVSAEFEGQELYWEFQSYEGRTQISETAARSAGLKTAISGPGKIIQTKMLYGTVRPNEEKVYHVQVPYSGRILKMHIKIGETVKKGQELAIVQSRETLGTYSVKAPEAGVILSRHGNPGEQIDDDDALLVLADLSEVWVDFAAFPKQRKLLQQGQVVTIKSSDNEYSAQAQIEYLAPVGSSASQSMLVRASLENPSGLWFPGLLVTGDVIITEDNVPLTVSVSALQSFRDFTVVFAKFGDYYEVRMLELGRRDNKNVEVLGGLKSGTEYVIGNSYLVKADIMKSGTSHDH